MRLIITEEEKNDIISKYKGNTDEKLLTYLKRHFPIYQREYDFGDKPYVHRSIMIDDRTRNLDDNKKYLVAKIYNEIEEVFPNLDVNIVRRTIKYYIDINRTLD